MAPAQVETEPAGLRHRAFVACVAAITLADLLHDGAHPARSGFLVIALVVVTVATLAALVRDTYPRVRTTVAIAACLLAGAFLTSGLDRFGERFRGDRREAATELRIVFKEGFELAGWSLVAPGLWDAALELRARARSPVALRLEPDHGP